MVNKQKIAFFCHPYHRGGVTRWMADAAIAYDMQGFDVYFVTVDPVKEFYSAKGRETMVQLLRKTVNSVKIISAIVGYEFEFGTPRYRAFIYKGLLIQLPVGTPVILSDDSVVWHSATSLSNYYPIAGVLHADEEHYYRLAEDHYKKIALFTCVSHRVHGTVQRRVPNFSTELIYTIPCGINLPVETTTPDGRDVIQLAYVGRVSKYQKRAGDLALICAELVKRSFRFHLSIIGDGDAKEPLQSAVNASNISDYVTFYGWRTQQEVAAHLANTDILLLTSDFEGTPIAMMEALAAGCGMVGTRVSGIEDYEHNPNARFCLKVYDTGNIAEAVRSIISLSQVQTQDRRKSARQLAEQEFSMAVCLDRYNAALAKIPDQYSGRPINSKLSIFDRLYSKLLAFPRKVRTGN